MFHYFGRLSVSHQYFENHNKNVYKLPQLLNFVFHTNWATSYLSCDGPVSDILLKLKKNCIFVKIVHEHFLHFHHGLLSPPTADCALTWESIFQRSRTLQVTFNSARSSCVQVEILSRHRFFGLLLLRFPSTMPSRQIFERPICMQHMNSDFVCNPEMMYIAELLSF